MSSPTLSWHINTAIDLFDSAAIIFNPATHNLRPAWAAGVRSRLSSSARETLQSVFPVPWIPVTWFYRMDPPGSATQALEILSQASPENRLVDLLDLPEEPPELRERMRQIIENGSWNKSDLMAVKAVAEKEEAGNKKNLKAWLNIVAQSQALGDRILSALEEYFDIFYREEEQRVRPYLVQAAAAGKKLAQKVSLQALIERLSHGIEFLDAPKYGHIIFAPSFWTTPLIAPGKVDADTLYFIYGVRPAGIPLIPGDPVPDDLHLSLKTLSDPTRLKICRLLRQAPHTPGELARELRLRPPTVTHHLQALRQARLVRITLTEDGRRTYTLRVDGLKDVLSGLAAFFDLPSEN